MPAEPENAITTPSYFVAEVETHDLAGFKSYADQFAATLVPFGGRLVSFGAPIVPLEGIETTKARAAIVVFPSPQAGSDWFASPVYRKIAPIRQRSAHTRAFSVSGLPLTDDQSARTTPLSDDPSNSKLRNEI
jgi:uncharacterized protein (DUF1330 family)